MSGDRLFLLEVGCEEIPAAALPAALEDLTARIIAELGGQAGLGGRCDAPPFGGPRRLVARIEGIRDREEDRVVQVTGPPVAAAFDKLGNPTKAALGFAKAQGVDAGTLERVRGEKGEVVAARRTVVGRTAAQVLAQACPRVLQAMRFPKMMKWGDRGYSFVRPVHWILALIDDEVVSFEFSGARSGRLTRGHRFLAPGPHEVRHAADYETVLRERGRMIVSMADRRRKIVEDRDRTAAAMGWRAAEDGALTDELVCLTECPGAIAGTFPADLLDIPEPVLVTAMRHHQKYFPVRDGSGRLAPGFIAIINREADAGGRIRRGNEWVLKARLADARFFWTEDRKRGLSDRLPDLDRVTFQEKLGSNLARTRRLEALSSWMADRIGADAATREAIATAARLSKTDLTTGMVGEFPELQGVMGGIYARAEGRPEAVARAIEDHYLPRSPDGDLPATIEGLVIALADKFDLLAGCFAVGLIPKGSADPYGLRRAAHGACRILMSPALAGCPGRISLREAIARSLALYSAQATAADGHTAGAVLEFTGQRLRFMMEAAGMRFDTARAVLAAGFDDVESAWRRAEALTDLRGPDHEADFDSLATSAKRIRNILAQAAGRGTHAEGLSIDPALLAEKEETALAEGVSRVAAAVRESIERSEYNRALREIASLRPLVDRFFDKVLVMAPDERLRRNRLALLAGLSALLSGVADFSEIVVEGETTEKRP